MTEPGRLSELLADSVEAETGWRPAANTLGGTSDARFFRRYCPVVEFGLVGTTMHQADEHVAVADIEGLTRIYEAFLRRFLAGLMPTWPRSPAPCRVPGSSQGGDARDAPVRPLGRGLLAVVRGDADRGAGLRRWSCSSSTASRAGPEACGTLLAELVAYVVGWVAFPVAAIFLTRLLGLAARYVPLIVANNWSAVVQIALYTAVVVLGTSCRRAARAHAARRHDRGPGLPVVRDPHRPGDHRRTAFGLVVVDVLLSITVSRGLDGLLLQRGAVAGCLLNGRVRSAA